MAAVCAFYHYTRSQVRELTLRDYSDLIDWRRHQQQQEQ